jgi:hypothetical protein
LRAALQAREAALSTTVAALVAAYTSAPADPQCGRLSAACRDGLTALRRAVDGFELAAADEDDAAGAADELRARRAAFDRRAACVCAAPVLRHCMCGMRADARARPRAACASPCATRRWRRTRRRATRRRERCASARRGRDGGGGDCVFRALL